MKQHLLAIGLFCLTLSLSAMPPLQLKIDSIVSEAGGSEERGGVFVAVINNGRVLISRAYGQTNTLEKATGLEESVLQIDSLKNEFIAVSILDLAKEGKLDLDKPLADYLPDIAEKCRLITPRQLLSHRSGLPEPMSLGNERTETHPSTTAVSLANLQPLFQPGSQSHFSSLDYQVFELLMARVAGQDLPACCRDGVLRPLGMTNTWFGNKLQIVEPGTAKSVSPVLSSESAAGGVYITLKDALSWELAVSSGKFYSKEMPELLGRNPNGRAAESFHYFLGSQVQSIGDHRTVTHDGGAVGVACSIFRVLDQKISVVVACNTNSSANSGSLSRRIAALFIADMNRAPM